MKLRNLIGIPMMVVLCGCAIAPMPDGSGYAVGFRASGTGASAQEIGSTVGKVAGAFGIPGGKYIGTLVGGVLATAGIGVAAHQRAKRIGVDEGFTEAQGLFSVPPGMKLVQA